MASFAIVRQDGAADKAEGSSILDVSTRYGWPGDGDIVPWNDDIHNSKLRWEFADPSDQAVSLAAVDEKKAGK